MNTNVITLGGWGFGPDWLDPVFDLLPHAPAITRLDVQSVVAQNEPASTLAQTLSASNEPVLVVGWSLGAILALDALAHEPDAVQSALLLSPCARFTATDDFPSGAPPAAPRAMQRGLKKRPERTLTDFQKAVVAPGQSPWPDTPLPTNLESLDAGLGYLARVDLRERLTACGAALPPITCLAGEEDQVIAAPSTFALQPLLPSAEFALLPDRGHAFFAQEPAPVAALIAALVERLESAS